MVSQETLKKVITLGHELDRDANIPDIDKVAGLFPRGYFSLFASPAGTGKTWFMQYLACRLSCGGNILAGLVPKSKRMKSVIFAGETGKYLLDKRLQATCWAYDKKRIHIYDAVDLQREDIPIYLNTPEGKATTLAIMAHEQPDIIWYDTLISFHIADESKQGEMTGIYTFLLKLAKEFNCAVVANHHTRKRSTKNTTARFTQDDIIGSNAGVRLAATAFIAEQINDPLQDDEGMPTINVHNAKTWMKRIPDFSYKFITDEGSGKLDFAIDWGTSADTKQWSLRERVQKYIEALDEYSYVKSAEVASALCVSQDSVRNYLDELVKKGKLERGRLMNATVWRVVSPDERL